MSLHEEVVDDSFRDRFKKLPVTSYEKAASSRKRLVRAYAIVRVVPFAGITQIRFQGYDLRLKKPPQLEAISKMHLMFIGCARYP